MKRRLLVGGAALLLAGCGGSGESSSNTTAPATTVIAADPGRRTIAVFVAAARSGNAASLWSLLSTDARRRLGPTVGRFRDGVARELHEGLGSFGAYEVVVSERITPEFGVVAIEGLRTVEGQRERGIYAVALRLEGKQWKVELGGPVHVRPIGPDPGAREPIVAQIAAAVSGRAGEGGAAGTAVMYLDGQTLNPEVRGTASNVTLFANLDPPLDPGRHTVVVFASGARDASATAWAFTVTKKH